MQMPEGLEELTLDEVAETLPISDDEIYRKCWSLLGSVSEDQRTPLGGDGSDGTVETPDGRLGDFKDKMNHHWNQFTPEQQKIIADAYRAAYE